jgi:hypothetical protein
MMKALFLARKGSSNSFVRCRTSQKKQSVVHRSDWKDAPYSVAPSQHDVPTMKQTASLHCKSQRCQTRKEQNSNSFKGKMFGLLCETWVTTIEVTPLNDTNNAWWSSTYSAMRSKHARTGIQMQYTSMQPEFHQNGDVRASGCFLASFPSPSHGSDLQSPGVPADTCQLSPQAPSHDFQLSAEPLLAFHCSVT